MPKEKAKIFDLIAFCTVWWVECPYCKYEQEVYLDDEVTFSDVICQNDIVCGRKFIVNINKWLKDNK